MDAPRFPQPFLESLLDVAPWADVLSLVSVDKREAVSRRWFIAARCVMLMSGISGHMPNGPSPHVITQFPGLRVDYMSHAWDCPDGATGFAVETEETSRNYQIPHTVTKFGISVNVFCEVKWPAALTHLYINKIVLLPEEIPLPPSVISIVFGIDFTCPTKHFIWPQALRRLEFHQKYTHKIGTSNLPSSLEDLTIGTYRMGELLDLPSGLKRLRINCGGTTDIRQDLRNARWPPGLVRLELGPGSINYNYNGVRTLCFEVPQSVKVLHVHHTIIPLVPPRPGLVVGAFEYGCSNFMYWPPWRGP
jgi:hypothetical protein